MSLQDPMVAWSRLMKRLEHFERSVLERDVREVPALVDACQNFLESGHFFDGNAQEEGTLPGPSGQSPRASAQPSGQITADHLRLLLEALQRTIAATEIAKHGIQEQMQRIQAGRRGLKGYRYLQPSARQRYLDITS